MCCGVGLFTAFTVGLRLPPCSASRTSSSPLQTASGTFNHIELCIKSKHCGRGKVDSERRVIEEVHHRCVRYRIVFSLVTEPLVAFNKSGGSTTSISISTYNSM